MKRMFIILTRATRSRLNHIIILACFSFCVEITWIMTQQVFWWEVSWDSLVQGEHGGLTIKRSQVRTQAATKFFILFIFLICFVYTIITRIVWASTFTHALNISVGSEPKLCSTPLGFGSSFGEKSSARLAMSSKKLGSARLAISCKKISVQLGLLYHLKKRVTLKSKIWANFWHFCQFFQV